MTTFSDFKLAVQHQFNKLQKHQLYRIEIEKEMLWFAYLESFPAGTNPKYKERTEHDCQCCRSFVRNIGGLVAIIDGKLETLWDIRVGGFYQVVADALATLVREQKIDNRFLTSEPSFGVDKNFGLEPDGVTSRVFHHFHLTMPKELVVRGLDINPKLSALQASKNVFLRSLTEITDEACAIVQDVIAQNSIYRVQEHKFAVDTFVKAKAEFKKLTSDREREFFAWSSLSLPESVLRIRNTSIGTFLTNLSEGMPLDRAVAAFEAVMDPTKYKRSTAPVTKSMLEIAKAKIAELELTDSLHRRYARLEDISVNNILFVDRSVKKNLLGDVFDDIASGLSDKSKSMDRVEEIPIDKLIADIVPKAQSMEVMFENHHRNNLVSLIAPENFTARGLFKWDNPFSWSYAGELADSIKERVKAAGGRIDAPLRCSLSWFNYDDLDLHMIEPDGFAIYFGDKVSRKTGGNLDVDMNAGGSVSRSAVENIVYPDLRKMSEGKYTLIVHQFSRREMTDVGFTAEIEILGKIHTFHYTPAVNLKEKIVVAEFTYTHKDGVQFTKTLPASHASRTVWNLPTQKFHKVNLMMLSPNYWDGHGVGNKHYFFFLDQCLNEGQARPFFNEFLRAELDPHRKVLEAVGAKLKTEESDRQLSGLGFSSTKRDSVLVKVSGSFTRILKVTF